jgi:hypothetical protein
MTFRDEYEYEVNGTVYYVSLEGQKSRLDNRVVNDIETISITDELGEMIDVDNEHYDEIYEDALNRDVELEVHSRDFDYYDEVG